MQRLIGSHAPPDTLELCLMDAPRNAKAPRVLPDCLGKQQCKGLETRVLHRLCISDRGDLAQ